MKFRSERKISALAEEITSVSHEFVAIHCFAIPWRIRSNEVLRLRGKRECTRQ